ncbi:MAG: hypothetical protein C0432_02260 [Candidatus Puniceispirillum sp.]|nr:hypothetical protein [Candidatus Puniceispirillum sp.]
MDEKKDLKMQMAEKIKASPAEQSVKEKIAVPGKNLYESGNLRSEVVEYILIRYKNDIESDPEFKSLEKQEIAKKLVSLKGINYDNIWFWNPDQLPDGLVYFYDDRNGDKVLYRSFDEEKKKILYKDANNERVKKRFVKIGLRYLDKSGKEKIKSLEFDEKTGLPINIFKESTTLEGKGSNVEFGENLEIQTLVTTDINGELYALFGESKPPSFAVSMIHQYSSPVDQKEFDTYELSAIKKALHQDSTQFKFDDLLRDKKISFVSKISDVQKSLSKNSWVSRKTVHIHFDSLDEAKKYIVQIGFTPSEVVKFVSINGKKEFGELLSKWSNWKKYAKSLELKSQGDISSVQFSALIKLNTIFSDIRIFVEDLKSDKIQKDTQRSELLNSLFHNLQQYFLDNNWFDYYFNLKTSPLPSEIITENIKLFIQLSILKAFDTLRLLDKSSCIVDYSRSETNFIKYSFLITQIVIERTKRNGTMFSQSLDELNAIGIDDILLFENISKLKKMDD